jgi:hypothetical protein
MKEKMMAILVKEVTEIMIAGARVRTVRRKRISRERATSRGSLASSMEMPIRGIGILSWADDSQGRMRRNRKTQKNTAETQVRYFLLFLFMFPSQQTLKTLTITSRKNPGN